ncbi:MAG: HTH domain-containing protein [Lachnospiraceae bacterium]|nr:HTH domain-containing protein [Lachnospiraceae bacterium]
MSANERRAEIMRILSERKQESMQVLATEFGVSDRTIKSDILALMAEYFLETVRGNGGGVRIADWYHPYKNIFSKGQISVLEQLMPKADEEQKQVLIQMIHEYGSNRCCSTVWDKLGDDSAVKLDNK